MRHWLPEPRILNVLIRSGISIGSEDGGPYQPLWRSELRKQLQEKPASDGKPLTREEADSCIDKALASGALDSDGIFTFRVKGTREQIVEQILEVCQLWNEPMRRRPKPRPMQLSWRCGASGYLRGSHGPYRSWS
jgi:hypothetical protein